MFHDPDSSHPTGGSLFFGEQSLGSFSPTFPPDFSHCQETLAAAWLVARPACQEVAYQKAQEGFEVAKVATAMAAEESSSAFWHGDSPWRALARAGVQELGKYVQEGPAGISVLCFLGMGMAAMGPQKAQRVAVPPRGREKSQA